MITQTIYSVSSELIKKARQTVPFESAKHPINHPTGNFFYDPWEINDDFKGTAFEEILKTLPFPKGEARIIILDNKKCYCGHSDIDDRWHLNIDSENAYLINLDRNEMFELTPDGFWYDMDAGSVHSAANFGNRIRIQLVVRKLLNRSNRKDLIKVSITTNLEDREDARYYFDNKISPFLNKANKKNAIDNFTYKDGIVHMEIIPEYIDKLKYISGNDFKVNIE